MNEIIEENTVIYKFSYPIQEVLKLDDMYVVILDYPLTKVFEPNVFCISREGKLLWQIEKKGEYKDNSAYTTSVYEEGKLIIYNFFGFAQEIDKKTGKILNGFETR